MSSLEELTKLAEENVLFDMDFANRLATGENLVAVTEATFTNSNRVSNSSDISIISFTYSGNTAQVRILNGQLYEQYEIKVTTNTNLGNTRIGKGLLRIIE